MNWLTWSAIGTGIYLLAKKPAGAELVPKGTLPTPAPTPSKTPAPTKPVTITKSVTVSGRKYNVTRAGLGIYKVELASDPSVSQLITQTGVLKESGDASKLAQLKADEAQFPGNLFT